MIARPEWWGGAECTVNRVGDCHYEQLERTGHANRLDDLERIASLGVERLRFPVLWERTWCSVRKECDFSWADPRVSRLNELGIDVIAGLLHHGSGPLHTHLLAPNFAEAFAQYAGAVARRYPSITYFTPVNEILTTSRFSALYGHWYPHAKDDRSFVRALLSQVTATQLAMEAIRVASPHAKLLATEDMGTVFSTPRLSYQARFENQRRWLSLDLLCGTVRPGHELYGYLTGVGGASKDELARIADTQCAPDIIGINYYVTSDRFLDDRLELYPQALHGTNSIHAYADVEAVRLQGGGIVGHYETLKSVWRRYEKPMALTEVHLGCHDEEEQARWVEEAWFGACQAARDGVDVRAVTAWSLFGSYDWNSLVTRCDGHYEAGAFDVRSEPPRSTRVAQTIRSFAHGQNGPQAQRAVGWWRREERSLYPACDSMQPPKSAECWSAREVSGVHALPGRKRAASGGD